MATNLRLDYEAASAQARIVQADADAIRTILYSLRDEVNANVNNASVWTGVSAGEFQKAWDNCAENFDAFINHITTIQEKIDYTANEVSTFDQQ